MSDSDGLAVGATAPDVSAPLVDPAGGTEVVSLSSLLDDRGVLLSFYPNDFSPRCVEEWCEIRDFRWFSTTDRLDVVGVSASRPFTHRKFIDFLDLDFPLYADCSLSLSDAFGVTYRTFKIAKRPRRSCFLVDQDRTIRYKWVADHRVDPSLATPDIGAIHEAVTSEIGVETADTFGFSE